MFRRTVCTLLAVALLTLASPLLAAPDGDHGARFSLTGWWDSLVAWALAPVGGDAEIERAPRAAAKDGETEPSDADDDGGTLSRHWAQLEPGG